MKLVDLSYFSEKSEKNPLSIIQKYQATSFFLEALSTHFTSVTAYRSQKNPSTQIIGNVHYIFTPEIKASRFSIPVKLHQQIQFLNPDVILVHGWMYPLQVIHLRKVLGTKCVICVQHHAESPASGFKRWIQALQFKQVNAGFFTSYEQAQQWFGVFKKQRIPKIYELAEGSSPYRMEQGVVANFEGQPSLLCVANLDENKDVSTLLHGFSKLVESYPLAALHVVYKNKKLEQKLMQQADKLGIQKQVFFHGEVAHSDLGNYYRAANYFVSASHSESTGFAVIEAISCGCIPVISNIPGHQKSTGNGTIGALWEPGNAADFVKKLTALMKQDKENLKHNCLLYFDERLSYAALAKQAYTAFYEMRAKI